MKTILYIVNVSSFFISHRLPIAIEAINRGYKVIVASGDSEGQSKLAPYGIEHALLPMSRSGRSIVKELKLVIAITRLIKKINPTLIHTISIKPVIYTAIINRFITKKPCISAVTGLGYSFHRKGIKGSLFKHFLTTLYRVGLKDKRQLIIFQNQDNLELFVNKKMVHKGAVKKIKGSGVCLKTFSYQKQPNSSDLTVLLPARMLWDKGVGEFITVAKRYLAEKRQVKFLLAGGLDIDNPAFIAESMLKEWQQLSNVSWLGQRDDMPQLMEQSDIVCLPSYHEGMPNALLEAAACGRAVITTNVAGCREAIIPGQTGLLVEHKNAEQLYDAMNILTEDVSLRIKYGLNARKMAEKEFSIDKVVKETLALYEKAGSFTSSLELSLQ